MKTDYTPKREEFAGSAPADSLSGIAKACFRKLTWHCITIQVTRHEYAVIPVNVQNVYAGLLDLLRLQRSQYRSQQQRWAGRVYCPTLPRA